MSIRRCILSIIALMVGFSCFGQGGSSSGSEPKQVAVFVYFDELVATSVYDLRSELYITLGYALRNSYQVVDRTDEIISALKGGYDYQGRGIVQDNQLFPIGEQLGVDYLYVVRISYYADYALQFFFECKLVNVKTCQIEKQWMYPGDGDIIVSSLSPQVQHQVGEALAKLFIIESLNDSADEAVPIDLLDTEPSFMGGDKFKFEQWVDENLVYPDKCRDKFRRRIYGNVLVRFTVNPDGSVSDVLILRPVHPLLDAEAVRVIKSSPAWSPGILNGRAVKVEYLLPVEFKKKK